MNWQKFNTVLFIAMTVAIVARSYWRKRARRRHDEAAAARALRRDRS